jgi:hypothetical protein
MLFKECRDALLVQLAMPLNPTQIASCYDELAECFREVRPNRKRQIGKVRSKITP